MSTPKKRGRPAGKTRGNFEAGKLDAWSAGEYGATVRVRAMGGKLVLHWQDATTGKPRKKVFAKADTLELRARAAGFAVKLAESLRAGVPAAIDEADAGGDQPQAKKLEELTIEDAVLLYMRRFPGFTREMLDWTERQIEHWHRTLPEQVREDPDNPSASTLATDVRAFQRIFRSEAFGRALRVVDVEPAHMRAFKAEVATKYSPRTIANVRDRLSCVFRHIMVYYRSSIGLRYNPIDGGKVDRTKAVVLRYTPDERTKLLTKVRELIRGGQYWRLFVLLGVSQSGRRMGSMLRLTAADHDFETNRVTWQARWAKARNYGRGDEVRPMAPDHRTAVLWALREHPNPLGPEHPIFWRKADPTRHTSRQRLTDQLHELEMLAGVEYIRGRSLHSMRRAIVTLLADALGDGQAAEFTGMTVKNVRAFSYKQVDEEVMDQTAEAIRPILNDEDLSR